MHNMELNKEFQDLKESLQFEVNGIHVFGYGSLLWKLDFEIETETFGYLDGFRREFWLLSDDHRGTPERFLKF